MSPTPSASFSPRPGTSLYYALHMVPAAARPGVRAWASWWHDISAIAFSVSDPGVAQSKLLWWQKEIERSFDGQPQHPVTEALFRPGALPSSARLPPPPCWLEQIEGQLKLVDHTRWLDERSLRQHIEQTTGRACEGAAHLLGVRSPAALDSSRALGVALRQAHDLARLGQDARAGWLHVPVNVLQAHDVKAHELVRPQSQVEPSHWPALLASLHDQASSNLKAAQVAINALPRDERRALRPLRALARCHGQLIDRIAASGSQVLHERLVLTPLRKWWLTRTTF